MNKIIHLSLARKSNPTFMDIVQSATAPSITFILDDYQPEPGATARIYILKKDAEVYNDCTLSGNQVEYTPTPGSFDVPGPCVAQLQILKGTDVAVSYRIFTMVEPNLILGSAAPATTEFDTLTNLIADAEQYDSEIEGLQLNVEELYARTDSYKFPYVTVQQFGAIGDGETDDTTAFNRAINYAKANKYTVYIPPGTYLLNEIIYSDESIVPENRGTYTEKGLIVSENINTSQIGTKLEKGIIQSNLNVPEGQWLGGSCYDSSRDRVVLGFGDDEDTSGFLVAVDKDLETVQQSKTINVRTHLNSLTYNPITDSIYAPGRPILNTIFEIDADTLEVTDTIVLSEINDVIRRVAYDTKNDIYYVATNSVTYVYNGDFSEIIKSFSCSNLWLAQQLGVPTVTMQANFVIDEQYVICCDVDGSANTVEPKKERAIVQFDYDTNQVKKAYFMNSITGYDEFESMLEFDGNYYALGAHSLYTIYVSRLFLGEDQQTSDSSTIHCAYIPSYTDINNLRTPGRYICQSSTVAGTLLNSPTTTSFNMEVIPTARNGYVVQILTTAIGFIYIRSWDSYRDLWTNYEPQLIKDSGTSNDWNYRVYANKDFNACMRKYIGTVSSWTQAGTSGVYYSNLISIPLPDIGNFDYWTATANAGSQSYVTNLSISDNALKFRLVRPVNNSVDIDVNIYLTGKLR